MRLLERQVKTYILSATQAEVEWLHSFLSFKLSTGKSFSFLYSDNSFPSGLIHLVVKGCTRDGIPLDITKGYAPLIADSAALDTPAYAWLRPHQLEALRSLLRGGARGIIEHATGAGKTAIMVALLMLLRGQKALVMLPSVELLKQFRRAYMRWVGEEIGYCGDGTWNPKLHTAATYQTMHRDLNSKSQRYDFTAVRALLIDEAHSAASQTFWSCAMSCDSAVVRVGFSATAFMRLDKKNLYVMAATGPVQHRLTAGDAVQTGVIAKPTIRIVRYPHIPVFGPPHEVYRTAISLSAKRNMLVVSEVRLLPKPCLVFVREIQHGDELDRALNAAGMKTAFVQRKTKQKQALVLALQSGELDVLVCSPIFRQGIDIPEVRSCLNAAGGKSAIDALQRLGRGTRLTATKTTLEYVDIADYDCGCDGGHGWCRAFSQWSKDRQKAYVSAGYACVT